LEVDEELRKERTWMQTSKGSYRFQRERYLLRGQSVLEQAWLLLQAMKADKSRENLKKQGRHQCKCHARNLHDLHRNRHYVSFQQEATTRL
jgi:hypothetical protein